MFLKWAVVLSASACLIATACGGDDDESPAPSAGASGTGAGTAGAAEGGGGAGGEGGGGESSLVARGDYLVNHVAACPDCHTPRDDMGAPVKTQFLSGAECFVKLPTGACLNSANLTNDETGLANYTDSEIKHMIKDGIRPTKNGEQPLSPVMPYYVFHNITAEDMDAIVAYLRTVPAVTHEVPASDDAFAVPAAANPLDMSLVPTPAKDFPERASALRGRYLATQVGVCIECHTQHTMNSPDVLDTDKFFAGGESFDVGFATSVSANLTSDPDTGLGDWTTDQIVAVLLQGVDDEGKGICPPMPVGPQGAFGGLSAGDALDIANYIKSLPPIKNQVDDMCSFPPG